MPECRMNSERIIIFVLNFRNATKYEGGCPVTELKFEARDLINLCAGVVFTSTGVIVGGNFRYFERK